MGRVVGGKFTASLTVWWSVMVGISVAGFLVVSMDTIRIREPWAASPSDVAGDLVGTLIVGVAVLWVLASVLSGPMAGALLLIGRGGRVRALGILFAVVSAALSVLVLSATAAMLSWFVWVALYDTNQCFDLCSLTR